MTWNYEYIVERLQAHFKTDVQCRFSRFLKDFTDLLPFQHSLFSKVDPAGAVEKLITTSILITGDLSFGRDSTKYGQVMYAGYPCKF